MRTSTLILATAISFSFILITMFSCKKDQQVLKNSVKLPCVSEPVISSFELTKIQGPNTLDVGDVTVWNDNEFVYVQVIANSSFENSKLYLGNCDNVPAVLNGTHNNVNHDPVVSIYTYTFSNTYSPGDQLCFSMGVSGSRKSNGSYIIREICACEIETGDFRTQSKGGWGATPNGTNAAAYMYDHWSSISSVTIGCESNSLIFTSAEEVTEYLPNGSNESSPFNTDLATQITALTISIALDEGVEDFGASDSHLACMVIETDIEGLSDFNGMTVSDVLELANDVLGGCSTEYNFDQMNAIIEAINQNFHNGDTNNGLLTCGDC